MISRISNARSTACAPPPCFGDVAIATISVRQPDYFQKAEVFVHIMVRRLTPEAPTPACFGAPV
jgi:hypothetical protein